MQEGYITMSTQEVERLQVIQRLKQKALKQAQAAKLLGLSIRQIKRLLRGFKRQGPEALVSKHRNKPSNHAYTQAFKDEALRAITEHYPDFGPTLASEKLALRQGIKMSVETTRQLMIRAGLWKEKTQKKKIIHPPRLRRGCYGELIQIDGSPHDWFEGRGPRCTLIVFIDDATSRVQWMRFVEAETTFAYFKVLRLYMERYGKPLELYSDQFGVFKVNMKEAKTGTGLTQFGRAMKALDITLIWARSAPAKGRVERSNLTQQDRLVKELRLEGICTMEAGNQFLEEHYTEYHNQKFAVSPRKPMDAHRSCPRSSEMDLCFTLQATRIVQKNITIQYKNKIYNLEAPGKGYRLRQAQVTVCESESGAITILHNAQSLSYTVLDKKQQYAEAVSSKVLESRSMLKERPTVKPPANHPWRRCDESVTKRSVASGYVLQPLLRPLCSPAAISATIHPS